MPIRLIKESDHTAIAGLISQLSYPSTPGETATRLAGLDETLDSVVVYEEQGAIVGFMHLKILKAVHRGLSVEIVALVVNQDQRRCGIGRKLLLHACEWAKSHDINEVWLRSADYRIDAHRFYENAGFTKRSTSQTFFKKLST